MTTLRTSRKTGPARALALLLACVCLWMGTGVALDHTEDLRPLPAGLSTHLAPAAESHAAPLITQAPCLACQWEGIASDPQTPGIYVPSPPPADLPLSDALPGLPLSAVFHRAQPRAPPRPAA